MKNIKDEVARENGYNDWYTTYSEPMDFEEREKLVNALIIKVCRKQQEICAEAAETKGSMEYTGNNEGLLYKYTTVVDKDSILNSKLATDE